MDLRFARAYVILVGYIGDDEYKREWLKYWMEKRERNIYAVTKMAEKYHRESYATVVRAIQSEWKFFQLVTKDMKHEFREWKKFCRKPFCLVFSLENLKPSSFCRNYKYAEGK